MTSVTKLIAFFLLSASLFVYNPVDATQVGTQAMSVRDQSSMSDLQVNEQYQSALDGYNDLLEGNVDKDGWINYSGIQEEQDKLRDYISSLANIDMSALDRDHQLATYINAYNAFTLMLILEYWDNGKLQSIFDIPENRRWDDVRWQVGANTYSLNQIEHTLIRPVFNEPRIHFALVCAAYSCPPLRNEVYDSTMIEDQLNSQAQYVHDHKRWYQYDANQKKVMLTKLYEWYATDFEINVQGILYFIAQYRPEIATLLNNGEEPEIQWIPYDWRLNDIQNKPQ
ncbi:hypothetical protein KS4_22370 [Poriferisphaera corsica]|uniref:DUF547 domain-containing protein n=1 Tax=Poriferisphaera corsica TaxID=2528020 RepID=A0A517YVC0_9BACT|nr:DUF547 domain-containing protein [Poriferisphaera corsica]QDU34175.1 hypothetical protein KS4_22370 [Poriferisphaera corsica]